MEVVSVNHEQMGKAFQGQGRGGGWVGGYTYSVGTLQWVVNMENDSQGWSAQSHFLFSLFHDCNVFQLFLLFVILTKHFLTVIVIF